MTKAYEVMTKSLAICHPDDTVADVARIMKDRDIGDVLIAEDGKLLGIVTDRDLAVNALTDPEEALHSPISKYMTKSLVTGEAGWTMNKIADTMAKYQIRRLPILDAGEVVGIVSLGDVARYHRRKDVVSDSLKDISKPHGLSAFRKNGGIGSWLGLSFLALSAVMAAWLTWSHTGREFRKNMMKSKAYYSTAQAVNMARDKVNEAATSKTAKNLRRQVSSRVRSNLKDISSQLPTITYKPAKHRRAWFS